MSTETCKHGTNTINFCEQCLREKYGDRTLTGCPDLLAAWDMAHDSLTELADAARQCGHQEFAREAETIADALESRVTALSNMARSTAANSDSLPPKPPPAPNTLKAIQP